LNIHIEPANKTIVYAKSEFANHPQKDWPVVKGKPEALLG